tara:strand:- start:30049 stop:30936 length:888 start_codon:yes stop_codon:yes gene_type:complete
MAAVSILICSPANKANADEAAPVTASIVVGQDACDLGVSLASNDASEALAILFLERCHRTIPSKEIRQSMHEVRTQIRKTMHKRAPVSLALTPEIAQATLVAIDASSEYQGHILVNEDELWLREGRYELEVTAEGFEGGRFAIVVDNTDRILIPITLRPAPRTVDTDIDMTEERGAELGQVSSATDPRKKEFKTLLAKRYQRAPTPTPLPVDRDDTRERGPWPFIATGVGVASIGAGIALQVGDKTGPAIAAYGLGAVFGGVATYLFLNEANKPSRALAFDVVQGGAIVGLFGEL